MDWREQSVILTLTLAFAIVIAASNIAWAIAFYYTVKAVS